MDIKKLKDDIKNHNQKYDSKKGDSIASKLRNRIINGNHTDSEWLQLQKEVREYIKSNPGKSELAILQDGCDMLNMVCSGIKWKNNH